MAVIHWNSGSSTQVGLVPGLEQLSELTSPALRDPDPLYCPPVILHQPPHRASENMFSFNPQKQLAQEGTSTSLSRGQGMLTKGPLFPKFAF